MLLQRAVCSLVQTCHIQNVLPPGQLGVGTGNRVGALAKSEAFCFIECVLICPTFCTGSCCQWVYQVDGWPRLEGRGRWLKEGCGGGV